MAAVRSAFKPEFINRLDDVLIFDALSEERAGADRRHPARPAAEAAGAAPAHAGGVAAGAKQWLAMRGFDPVYGARPLRRLVQQAIGDQLAKMLLAGDVHDGDTVPVNVSPDGETAWSWS